MAERGVDNDPTNLADPLIPAARLRALVLEGEQLVASSIPDNVVSGIAGSIVSDAASRDAGSSTTGALASAVARLRGGDRSPRR